MSSIENKVVSLSFDGAQFQRGMAQSMQAIDNLTANLERFNANNGFAGLQQQVDSVNLSNISNGVDQISSKFDAMGVVAFSVLNRMSNAAMDAGRSLVQHVLDPITGKGRQRALALEQARFLFQGLGQDVEASMESALEAVRGTAYGLDEAATLAGIFGASGIQAGDELTRALRGVAGVSAITGRGFAEMGGIFQNIAALGKVTNNDLNSLALRGLGIGKIAEKFGVTETELREMATAGTISFKQFSDVMYEAFGEHAVRANETYTGSLANLNAAFSRVGAAFYTGKLEALRVIFNALAPAIDKVKEALDPVIRAFSWLAISNAHKIADWIEGIDFSYITDAFSHLPAILVNIWNAIKSVLKPIKEAFRDIFPSDGVNQLQLILMAIQRFTSKLRISGSTAHQVRNIFRGVFSVFSIGWSVIKGLVTVIGAFIGALSGGESGALKFAGGLGKMLMHLKEILVDGGAIQAFFEVVAEKITRFVNAIKDSGPVKAFGDALRDVGEWMGRIFGGGDDEGDGTERRFGRIQDRLDSLSSSGEKLSVVWETIRSGFQRLGDFLMRYIDRVKEAFSGWWDSLKESFSEGNFSQMGDLVNTGLVAAITGVLWQLTHGGVNFNVMSSLIFRVKLAVNELTTTLKAMQMELRARALLKIAQAVALLAVSMVALSLIDSAALTKALVAMSVGFGQLVASTALLDLLVTGPTSAAKLFVLGEALIMMSIAMIALGAAVAIFGAMDVDTLAKGIIGLAAALTVIGIAGKLMQGQGLTLAGLGLALIPLSIGLSLLAGAIAIFNTLGTDTVAEGLLKIGASLAVFGVAAWLMQSVIPQIALLGFALIPLSAGLSAVAGVLAIFDTMDPGIVAESLLEIAAALAVLGVAAYLLQPVIPQMALLGFALLPIATGLAAVAGVLAIFNMIGLEGIAVGLLGVVGALAILGAGSLLLSNVTPMMAALGVALLPLAAGLAATAIAIAMFAQIGFPELLSGLLGIALSFAVLGIAATLLSETIPFIAAFGAALLLVSGAFALFGAGSWLLADAFRITVVALREIAALAPEAWDSIIDGLSHAITIIPDLLSQLAEGILAFIDTFFSGLPNSLEGIYDVIELMFTQMLTAIVEFSPMIAEAVIAVLDALFTVLRDKYPEWVVLGYEMLTALLTGIRDNIGPITELVSDIIVNFLTALTANVPSLVKAGQDFLIALLQGIGSQIALVAAAGAHVIIGFLNGLAGQMPGIVTAAVNVIVGFLTGIENNIGRIIGKGKDIVLKLIEGLGNAANEIAVGALETILVFINSLTNAINIYAPQLREAALDLGYAIINGATGGVLEKIGDLRDTVTNAFSGLVDTGLRAIGARSPARDFYPHGRYIMEGVAEGIKKDSTASNALESAMSYLADTYDEMATLGMLNPTITPVLDLTNVAHGADRLTTLLGGTSLSATVSTGQASAISAAETQRRAEIETKDAPAPGPTQIKFEQINYARDELSLEDLYRNTKSQLMLAKEELGVS